MKWARDQSGVSLVDAHTLLAFVAREKLITFQDSVGGEVVRVEVSTNRANASSLLGQPGGRLLVECPGDSNI